ncbi:hypothetical protein L1887_11550 [Cichorium endivia]|nr:hypothetical protein L1887_11550 [Cichorium endivia]
MLVCIKVLLNGGHGSYLIRRGTMVGFIVALVMKGCDESLTSPVQDREMRRNGESIEEREKEIDDVAVVIIKKKEEPDAQNANVTVNVEVVQWRLKFQRYGQRWIGCLDVGLLSGLKTKKSILWKGQLKANMWVWKVKFHILSSLQKLIYLQIGFKKMMLEAYRLQEDGCYYVLPSIHIMKGPVWLHTELAKGQLKRTHATISSTALLNGHDGSGKGTPDKSIFFANGLGKHAEQSS